MKKTILIPVDFSKTTQAATRFALSLASKIDGKLMLLHTYSVYRSSFVGEAGNIKEKERVEAEAHQKMEDLKAEMYKTNAEVEISVHFEKGSLMEAIVPFVEKNKVDLVISGTEGATGIKYVLLGSNAYDIAKLLPVPFVSVPTTSQSNAIQKVAFFTDYNPKDKKTLKSLVTTLDYKEFSYHFVHIHEDSSVSIETETKRLEEHVKELQASANIKNVTYELVHGKKSIDLVNEISKREEVNLLALTMKDASFFDKFFNKTLARAIIMQGDTPLFLKKV